MSASSSPRTIAVDVEDGEATIEEIFWDGTSEVLATVPGEDEELALKNFFPGALIEKTDVSIYLVTEAS